MTIDETPAEPQSSRGVGLMLLGGAIGLGSAAMLAWDGVACLRVLDVLFAHDLSGAVAGGARLIRMSWCPLGVAIGTTMTLLGHLQAARRSATSLVADVLIVLSAVFVGLAAFAVAYGIGGAYASFMDIATSDAAVKSDEVQAAMLEAATPVARGWMLLAVAQAGLLCAAVAQAMSRSTGPTSARVRPKIDFVSIAFVCLFGVIVSWSWFTYGSSVQQLPGQREIRAADIANSLQRFLSVTTLGAWSLWASAAAMALAAGLRCFKSMRTGT